MQRVKGTYTIKKTHSHGPHRRSSKDAKLHLVAFNAAAQAADKFCKVSDIVLADGVCSASCASLMPGRNKFLLSVMSRFDQPSAPDKSRDATPAQSQPAKFAKAGLYQSMSAVNGASWNDLTRARGASSSAVDLVADKLTCSGASCQVFRVIEVRSGIWGPHPGAVYPDWMSYTKCLPV